MTNLERQLSQYAAYHLDRNNIMCISSDLIGHHS